MAARAPRGQGLAGRARVGAGLTGPARIVRRSQTPPVRLDDSFILIFCASLSSALLCTAAKRCQIFSHASILSLCRSPSASLYSLCRKGARSFFSSPSLLSSHRFTLSPSTPPRPGWYLCFALLGFACACVYALHLVCFSTSLFQYFTVEMSLKVVCEAEANRTIGNRTHITRSYPLLHI